jgi:A/G-specific adenine glycosylase
VEARRRADQAPPVPLLTPAGLRALRRELLAAAGPVWRDLPWRGTRDPWLVLVSEVMLQQTQATRVVGPYRRFTTRFPTARSCAAAGPAAVVREWAGLGYNVRAVRLHRAAVEITQRHGGRVPDDLAALRSLPGVGPYTARAVLAFAFERPVGAVDTNVARLVARAVAGRGLVPGETQALADRLVPHDAAWRFNQALFDLGAAFCRARPACAACPLRRRCRWASAGSPDPDPGAARRRRQDRFAGSDREGRGRLVDALRNGPLAAGAVGSSAGWPDDPDRAARVAASLVDDGIATWRGGALSLA